MKKWTLKARLVLLHTVMMTCIVAPLLRQMQKSFTEPSK